MRNTKVLYFHRRKDTNEVFYVGIGNSKRPYKTYGRSDWWWNIVNKVGYNIEIVHQELSFEQACVLEKKYINEFGRKDLGLGPLVNHTDGGEGFQNMSEISNEKKRQSMLGKNAGKNGTWYGKTLYDETKKKISDYWFGKPKPKEQIKKMVETRMKKDNYRHTAKSKKNISNGLRKTFDNPDYIHPNTGYTHTQQAKNKMSEKNKGENNSSSVITEDIAIAIIKECENIEKNYGFIPRMVKKYGVSAHIIRNIKNGKTWNHLR